MGRNKPLDRKEGMDIECGAGRPEKVVKTLEHTLLSCTLNPNLVRCILVLESFTLTAKLVRHVDVRWMRSCAWMILTLTSSGG